MVVKSSLKKEAAEVRADGGNETSLATEIYLIPSPIFCVFCWKWRETDWNLELEREEEEEAMERTVS